MILGRKLLKRRKNEKNRFLLLVLTLISFFPFHHIVAMEVFVQPLDGENISIEVETSDTIEAIKEKIYDKDNNYAVDNQKLYYNDTEMTNGRTFGDYYSNSLGNIVRMELEKYFNVVFNANGGTFKNGEVLTIEKWENGLETLLETPTRDGYKFLGYFTEKKMEQNLN